MTENRMRMRKRIGGVETKNPRLRSKLPDGSPDEKVHPNNENTSDSEKKKWRCCYLYDAYAVMTFNNKILNLLGKGHISEARANAFCRIGQAQLSAIELYKLQAEMRTMIDKLNSRYEEREQVYEAQSS